MPDTTHDVVERTGRTPLGATVVPLLALCVFIAYIDRGNLATAGPLLQRELHLSSTELGTLMSSFYWAYVPGQLLSASLAERFTPYRVLALGVGLWSLATAASGLASGFAALLVLRLVVGLAESAAYPCISKLFAQHLPGEKLGVANAQIQLGPSLGPAFGTYVGGQVMARVGWRPTFLGFGVASLLWLVPWRAATPRTPAFAGGSVHGGPNARASGQAPAYATLLKRREVWGTCVGHFCFTYPSYFVIYWLPMYLVRARGFSVARMATVGGLVYVVTAAGALLTGLACDRRMRAGASADAVRRSALVAGCAITAASLVAVAFGSAAVAIAGLFCAGFAIGSMGPNVFATAQTLAGPRAAGKWMGVQNSFGNLAGVVAPVVTGYLVDRTGQFFWAFVVAGAVALTGIVAWVLVIPRIAPLDWPARSATP